MPPWLTAMSVAFARAMPPCLMSMCVAVAWLTPPLDDVQRAGGDLVEAAPG